MSSAQTYKAIHTFVSLRSVNSPRILFIYMIWEVSVKGEVGKLSGLIGLLLPVPCAQQLYLGHIDICPVHSTCSIVKCSQATRDKRDDGVEAGIRVRARKLKSLIDGILYIACELIESEQLIT